MEMKTSGTFINSNYIRYVDYLKNATSRRGGLHYKEQCSLFAFYRRQVAKFYDINMRKRYLRHWLINRDKTKDKTFPRYTNL